MKLMTVREAARRAHSAGVNEARLARIIDRFVLPEPMSAGAGGVGVNLLPVREVARQVGIKDPKTIKRWIAQSKLPAVRLSDSRSGHLRVDQADLDRFVQRLPLAAARERWRVGGRR